MIIRKKFKFEAAHIVRNCSSDRCKKTVHGHSYKVEVFLTSDKLDAGDMIYDFGLMKDMKEFIDLWDHTMLIWTGDNGQFKVDMRKHSDRWLMLGFNPTAEGMALFFLTIFSYIYADKNMKNQEGDVRIKSVRVHETDTGYAEAFAEDLFNAGMDINTTFIVSEELRNGMPFSLLRSIESLISNL